MSSELTEVVAFLDALRDRHADRFPGVLAPKFLSFMGTTSRPGQHARLSIHPLRGVDGDGAPRALTMRLGGALPTAPGEGDCVTVHVPLLEQFAGYQVKTRPLGGGLSETDLVSQDGPGVAVHGRQIFTVHHSPWSLRFFEELPLAEIQGLCAAVRHAVVAVGETANVSPRFVFHHAVRDGRLRLFHGDGLALKTAINLKANRRESRLVVDLDDLRGYVLRGEVEPFLEHDDLDAWARVEAGFTSGGWGEPSRCWRLTVDEIEPIAPIA